MPKGKQIKKAVVNPAQKMIVDKIIDSMCDIRKIESADVKGMTDLFKDEKEKRIEVDTATEIPDFLSTLQADVVSTFRLEDGINTDITVFKPPAHFDKKRVLTLPPAPTNLYARVVVVMGTHEIFYSDALGSFLGPRGFFVPQGHAIKMMSDQGKFTYDNKGLYDRQVYPGKGIKRPENRFLVVFDFTSDSEELITKSKEETTANVVKNLQSSGVSEGFFSSILKSFGF